MAGYIDNNPEITCYQEFPVYRPEILKEKSYYLFVALENKYLEVIQTIESYGLNEFEDYIYPSLNLVVVSENQRDYADMNGNEIKGIVDGFQASMAKGSKLIIGRNCKISKSVTIRLERNAFLTIGDKCVIDSHCSLTVRNNSVCQIGNNCHFCNNCFVLCMESAMVLIDDNFSGAPYLKLGAAQAAVCNIGRDCMFASDVRVKCSDSHNYYDLDNKINIGMQKEYNVNIGEHVWVGARSSLLYGTDIGAGSIVGLGSFVNKKYPQNTVFAGCPAKIIRKNVAWARASVPYMEERECFEKYCFSIE